MHSPILKKKQVNMATQKTFIEADKRAAKQVLSRLLKQHTVNSEISSVSPVTQINEEK